MDTLVTDSEVIGRGDLATQKVNPWVWRSPESM